MKDCHWSRHHQSLWLVLYYVLFGALHELTHVLVACLIGRGEALFQDGLFTFFFRTFVLRQCKLPALEQNDDDDYYCYCYYYLARHSAWIVSVALVWILRKHNYNKNAVLAATLTALEAVSTDLCGILSPTFTTSPAENSSNFTFLYCGNFGIILLHDAWCQEDGGKSALDVLEKMVQVTMMRGAQSGGTITFEPQSNGAFRGIRSRVVNKKRTDLSKLVRKKVQADISFSKGPRFISGHTRFATSSKATFEGTHPQQWTPPSPHRVYDFHVFRPHPANVVVENYVTHNGDFDFYIVNGRTYSLRVIQEYLSIVLGPMPAPVDSCAVAGIVDILRCQGSFALSARYVLCLALKTSNLKPDENFPQWKYFDQFGELCEEVLAELVQDLPFGEIEKNQRSILSEKLCNRLGLESDSLIYPFSQYLTDDEGEASIPTFCRLVVDAFFDNDLFFTVQTFLKYAKGSFGLCVTSSLDAKRQLVIAARGQTMSVAFYPSKGLICYGSEQAAVKAGLTYPFPGNDRGLFVTPGVDSDRALSAFEGERLDLDDLNGEVVLLDWSSDSSTRPPVSAPNQQLKRHKLMMGAIETVVFHESKATTDDSKIFHRMTALSNNPMILPLPKESRDPVLTDIQDIPRICKAIQDEWDIDKMHSSLNRLTAFNLSRCLRQRLETRVKGEMHPKAVDILLTGCEVSLWLAEQFASDLQKAFPNLTIQAISSNKLLGLYGQDISVPSLGFPTAPQTHHLDDTIIIIVSHSGGTFSPLSCSNLLQSKTENLFVVTSEWDTQISKQLRAMDSIDDDHHHRTTILNSRIFTTGVGMRPAEPCSVSVVATHQLLTNLFQYICVVILSDQRFRQCSAAAISEQDLQILEKCNRSNIAALSDIVSTDSRGEGFIPQEVTDTTLALRAAGNLWAEHVLENARAYVLTFLYIFGTIVSGYPLAFGIATVTGLEIGDWIFLIRFLDAAIYFWMPQINILLIRIVQGRNLKHRMVGRTVVIGDIPWVSQAAEAFLSKLFACSYSIAGLSVMSGNPADHLVHRHTHRVVRGSLVVCGRPDGRLSALSTAEASVCLSVNQASSIQSWGGTCESITIGHNPVKLGLTHNGIFLKRKRPMFLCERMLVEADIKEERESMYSKGESTHTSSDVEAISIVENNKTSRSLLREQASAALCCIKKMLCRRNRVQGFMDTSRQSSLMPSVHRKRSAAALIGAYTNFEEQTTREYVKQRDVDDEPATEEAMTVEAIITEALERKKFSDEAKNLFSAVDEDSDGFVTWDEFLKSPFKEKSDLSDDQLRTFFDIADTDSTGKLAYREFLELMKLFDDEPPKMPPSNRNKRGVIQIEPSRERYFGEIIRRYNSGKDSMENIDFWLARRQHFSQELYETRVASMQRFVAMAVMFHQMGKRVQEFFPWISFGVWGYRMDRTHSIMRIATTASPVSGADVKRRIRRLQLARKIQHSIHVIETAFADYRRKKRSASKRTATGGPTDTPCLALDVSSVKRKHSKLERSYYWR